MSAITQELRSKVWYKGLVGKETEIDRRKVTRSTYREGVKICLDRARLMTESLRETEGEPMVIRRAKAFASVVDGMRIYIKDGERIVGGTASGPESLPFFPELSYQWVLDSIENVNTGLLDDKGKKEIREICQYWKGKSAEDRVKALIPNELMDYLEFRNNGACYANNFVYAGSVTSPNLEKVLKIGLKGVLQETEARLEELKREMANGSYKATEYIGKRNFLEAGIISLKAAMRFARRYAEKAKELAGKESNPTRKKGLEEIAQVCDHVPAKPARTLQEALQCYFFIQILSRQIEFMGYGCGQRFDQLMYPYYKKEKEEGKIAREEAQELLEFLWVKMEELGNLLSDGHGAGGSLYQTMNMGGITPEGDDATNEMSYLMMDASQAMQTTQPTFALRWHPKTPQDLVYRAIDLIRSGIGYPAFFNDEVIIPTLLTRGVPLKNARNYTIHACVYWSIPGKSVATTVSVTGDLSLGKCLELALNEGKDPITGKQIGELTPDPLTFTCLEDVMDAYRRQVRFFTDKIARIGNITEGVFREYIQRPFMSTLIDGCIEEGKDCTALKYWPSHTIIPSGGIDVADSMSAIETLVFDKKKITMNELLSAIKSNFEGKEELRQMLIHESPKFGNDNELVDLIAREVNIASQEECSKSLDIDGGSWRFEGSTASSFYPIGKKTGALPSGRKAKEFFADGSISPVGGMDTRGPTATLKSISKVDPQLAYNFLLNQRFMPQFLEGENKKVFYEYLRTWNDLGIHHIQFNIADEAILRDAQRNPEKYPNLIVRVAGYSVYFVDLAAGVQEDVIRRTIQSFSS